jgi:hypothetical protein
MDDLTVIGLALLLWGLCMLAIGACMKKRTAERQWETVATLWLVDEPGEAPSADSVSVADERQRPPDAGNTLPRSTSRRHGVSGSRGRRRRMR